MPTFNITAPDGRKYRVTGDNQEGALNALRSHLGDTGGAAPNQTGTFDDLIPSPQQQGSRAAGLFDDLIPDAGLPPQASRAESGGKIYDMQRLETALRNADAAGDTQAARTIADQIRKQRQMSGPWEKFQKPAEDGR